LVVRVAGVVGAEVVPDDRGRLVAELGAQAVQHADALAGVVGALQQVDAHPGRHLLAVAGRASVEAAISGTVALSDHPGATASTSPPKDDRSWARSRGSTLSRCPSMKESLHFGGLPRHIPAQCNSAPLITATRAPNSTAPTSSAATFRPWLIVHRAAGGVRR